MAKRFDTSLRESVGLILLVIGIAIAPMGWLGGGGVLSVAVLLVSIGIWLFYTQRIRMRDMAARQAEAEALQRENADDDGEPQNEQASASDTTANESRRNAN